jgi:hypothetical protein
MDESPFSLRTRSETAFNANATAAGVRNYRYTVVNDRTVLVDPHTCRIVQVID